MKIDAMRSSDVYKTFMNNNIRNNEKPIKADNVSKDTVEISAQSADLNSARELARMSGISRDVMNEGSENDDNYQLIKYLVDSGEYDVSSKDIAKSILTGKNCDTFA